MKPLPNRIDFIVVSAFVLNPLPRR